MNIIERGRAFLQSLQALAGRSAWAWQRCPACGSRLTIKNGSYTRRPWFFSGRQRVRVQRHLCHACGKSYAEQSALLVRGSWYSREVRRSAVDHWRAWAPALRRTAEFLRSWLGHQERWRLWRPLDDAATRRVVLFGGEYRASLAGLRGRGGAGQCAGTIAGHRTERGTGHGWSVGAAAGRRHPGGAAAGRQCHRAAVAAGGRRAGRPGGALAAPLRARPASGPGLGSAPRRHQ